jgi:hypothetical protein
MNIIKNKRILWLNVTWTFFLSLAVVETIIFYLGLNNLKPQYLNYSYLIKFVFEQHDNYIYWTDFLIIFFFTWLVSFMASNIEMLKTGEKESRSTEIIWLIIDAMAIFYIIRFILNKEIGITEILITILVVIILYFIRKYAIYYLGKTKVISMVLWVISIFILIRFYVYEIQGFIDLSIGDIGYLKDFIIIIIIFILGSILYPSADDILRKKNNIINPNTIILGLVIIIVGVGYISIQYPNTPGAEALIIKIFQSKGIITSEENIQAVRVIMNNHVLIRDGIFIILGIAAPYILYLLYRGFKMDKTN